jgi:hypothetical protein
LASNDPIVFMKLVYISVIWLTRMSLARFDALVFQRKKKNAHPRGTDQERCRCLVTIRLKLEHDFVSAQESRCPGWIEIGVHGG